MDHVKQLIELVQGMATDLNAVKEKQEIIEAEIAKNAEIAKRFPLGDLANPKAEELKACLGKYELSRQGRRLMDPNHHKHVMSEDTRQEMAKYFCLFIRAGVLHEKDAMQKFQEVYKTTTDIGDTGNVFPLPDIVDTEILTYARESSVILQQARIWDMTSNKQSFPSETGAAATYWGNTTVEAAPTVSEVELENVELSAYASVRQDTMMDARSDIVSWLTEAFAEAIGQALDTAAFTGDGEGLYGGVSGLLSAKCGYSVVMSGSTSFTQLSSDHLSEMISKLNGVRKIGGRFFMNGSVLHTVRTLKDEQSRPIFIETVGGPMSGTIWGYPYTEVVTMPSTSAANTAFVVFGNLRHFAVGRRLAVSALQVDPYGLWTTNRMRFKVYNRWALHVALPNGFCRLLTASS